MSSISFSTRMRHSVLMESGSATNKTTAARVASYFTLPDLSRGQRMNNTSQHAKSPLIERDEIIGSAAGGLGSRIARPDDDGGGQVLFPADSGDTGTVNPSNNHSPPDHQCSSRCTGSQRYFGQLPAVVEEWLSEVPYQSRSPSIQPFHSQ